ncbi:hypothetical protein ACFPRL_34320 [Pseudoclavibacter helvolus]
MALERSRARCRRRPCREPHQHHRHATLLGRRALRARHPQPDLPALDPALFAIRPHATSANDPGCARGVPSPELPAARPATRTRG